MPIGLPVNPKKNIPARDLVLSRRSFASSILVVAIPPSSPGWATESSPAAPPKQPEEFPTSAGRHGCKTVTDPSKTVVTCRGDVLVSKRSTTTASSEIRLAGIAATENGVSTSAVRNPSRFSPPWTYLTETESPTVAFKSLLAALQQVEPAAAMDVVDTNYENSGMYYVHAVIGEDTTSADDVEFLLRPEDQLVLYRSASRTSVFVYPLTQPVSDGNRNLKRMQKIRGILGWEELGYPQQGSKRF